MSERINKYLAERLGLSRREADELVSGGRVTIDGQMAAIGARVESSQRVTVDDQPVSASADYMYLAYHKPVGYVCSRRAQGDAPTIYDLLPAEYRQLKTVGRLDKNSSGLILLTNDGDFTQRMTHPRHRKTKLYQVELDQPLQPLHRQMISDHGVLLEDGKSQFEVERLIDGNDKSWQLTLHEGRNRQIRRTFAALGYTVVKLHRTEFGVYKLGDLSEGEFLIVNN